MHLRFEHVGKGRVLFAQIPWRRRRRREGDEEGGGFRQKKHGVFGFAHCYHSGVSAVTVTRRRQ